jgi:hypothetical protein
MPHGECGAGKTFRLTGSLICAIIWHKLRNWSEQWQDVHLDQTATTSSTL